MNFKGIQKLKQCCYLKDLINVIVLEKLKEDILTPEVVETVKYLTSDAFRLDENKRPKNDVPLQTFRKLNVDWN